jgi:hypothetical protein
VNFDQRVLMDQQREIDVSEEAPKEDSALDTEATDTEVEKRDLSRLRRWKSDEAPLRRPGGKRATARRKSSGFFVS